ncbi:hypothetical protein MBH78_19295 [Oceanimonas sp. NS1]|nr:hypothetical protein [Oceanimonas sp. NS1]
MSKLIKGLKAAVLAATLAGVGLAGYGYHQWQRLESLTITPGSTCCLWCTAAKPRCN